MKFILIVNLILNSTLFALDKRLTVETVQGEKVEVSLKKIAKALREDFNKNDLSTEKTTWVRNSVILDKPKFRVDGVWYPFDRNTSSRYNFGNAHICYTFGFTQQLEARSDDTNPDTARQFPVVEVDHFGRYVKTRTTHIAAITTSVTCTP